MNITLPVVFLVSALTQSSSFAQSTRYENLVFEGGGVRGIAYVGVLDAMTKKNMMNDIQSVAGTSAGAMIALTVSLGYSAEEIQTIVEKTEFKEFNDGKYFLFGGFHRVARNYGWYRGNKFDLWIDKIIADKTGDGNITFEGLKQRGFKNLFVTGTCLNRQRLIIFSHQTYPKMKVKDAVRISMSIPLYFEAVMIDKTGTVVKKPGDRTDLDLVMDGGLIGNFPIDVFDSVNYDAESNKVRIANYRTIGVRIDSDDQIENDKLTKELIKQQVTDFKSYMEAFYILVIETLNRSQLRSDDWKRTISVSSKNVGPKITRLTNEQKQDLIESGRQGVTRFFAGR